MSYTALYRKKRPQKFGDIVGQPHVVRALTNQIKSGTVSHAYLFCGTRGTGKTTAAKVFARAVNCENPRDGEPCNECETCLGILSERNLGVAEIDAASNNGVDYIRELREEVKYPPTEGRYKVYIIDEVHMLSAGAFNALLKTLEEPPAHAVFVLATTDPQKIPATILSRCQRYDFKRITEPDMIATMQGYLDADGVTGVDAAALAVIAGQSDGAMRDALSILDQALSLYSGEAIGEEKIYEMLGAVDRRVLFDFTYALAVSDAAGLFEIIDAAAKAGRDMNQFAADLIQHFRNVLAAGLTNGNGRQNGSALAADADYKPDAALTATGAEMLRQSGRVRSELLIHWVLTFSEAQRDMRYAPNPRAALEVTVLRLCSGAGNGDKDTDLESVLVRLAKLEAQLEHLAENGVAVKAEGGSGSSGGDNSPTGENPFSQSQSNGKASEISPALPESFAAPAVEPALFKKIQLSWDAFCREFPIALRSMLSVCGIEQDGAVIRIVSDNKANMEFIKAREKIISEKMILKYGLPDTVNLAFIVRDAYNKFTKKETAMDADSKSTPVKPEAPPVKSDSQPDAPPFTEDDWAGLGEQVDMSEGEW